MMSKARSKISNLEKKMRTFEDDLSRLENIHSNSTFAQSLRNQFEMLMDRFDARMRFFHSTCEKVKQSKNEEIDRKMRLLIPDVEDREIQKVQASNDPEKILQELQMNRDLADIMADL